MKFPPMAIASGLHRISGLVLFLLLPFMLYFLSLSLSSAENFSKLSILFANPCNKFLLWAFSAALIYHLLAGIRHLLMDLGLGEDVNAGRYSAVFVIVLAVILTIFLGIWLW